MGPMRAFSAPLPTLMVGLVVGILLVDPANAQSSQDLQPLSKQIEQLYEAGKYPEAESLIKRGLVIREKALSPDHADVGQSLANLAMIYQVQGRYAEAEPLHKRALLITEKALGTEHRDLAQWLNNLAELYRVQG